MKTQSLLKFTLIALMLLAANPGARAAAQNASSPNVDQGFLSALEWRFVGPYRGGRVIAVAGVIDEPLVYYFGAAHSGVWKTTDAGINWRNVSGSFFNFPAVGALEVSRSHPNVIYAGTGEALPRQVVSPGDGVYKSTDGGDTWTNVGLRETRHIARLRIHPTNPNIVYVAAMGDMFGPNPDRGIYRTMDGGDTWERILYKGEMAGAVDISIDLTNPQVIFAALNHHIEYPWDQESGGPTTGLFKTTDGGDNWTDITRNPGMPTELIGKMGVDISPTDANRVYALIEADGGQGGIYRSDDGGSTWQMTHNDLGKMECPTSYSHITADPQDPDVVYILPYGGIYKSTDAGQTVRYQPTGNWDHHALWINPNNTDQMINGGDGGATVTLDGGKSWSILDNQPTANMLSLAVDDQDPYWIYGAQDDNSHISMPSRATNDRSIGWAQYVLLPSGEGGHTAVTPDGSVLYMADRATIIRLDQKTGETRNISVWPEAVVGALTKDVEYRFYYTQPMRLAQHDSGKFYTAAQYLLRTADEGHSWDKISPDLTRNRQEVMGEFTGGPITSLGSSLFYSSLIRTIAESPRKEGELWIGTDDSNVQFSPNGGRTWNDVSPPDLPEWTTITAIDVSHHEPGTVYIAGERHRISDRTPYLYKTTDYGNTWTRITKGIRENDYTWVIREDPVRPGLLYAGTETGAYVSFNAGDAWQSLQQNLPPVMVKYILVKDDDIVIATHGRGFWIMDNIAAIRAITPEVAAAPVHLFEVAHTLREFRAGRSWSGSKSRHVGNNPPSGVMIEYYLAQKPSSEVMITITESNGDIIQQFSSSTSGRRKPATTPGMNRFLWNMRYPNARLPRVAGAMSHVPAFGRRQSSAPVAPPGQYTVRLTVDGQDYEQPFEIQKDPRLNATNADIKAQFNFVVDIQERIMQVADTIMEIRELRGQLDDRLPQLSAESKIKADNIRKQLREIEGILTLWMGSTDHPMMWYGPGLIDKLSRLSSVVNDNAKTTESMHTIFKQVSERFEVQSNRLKKLIEDEIKPLLTGVGAQIR